MNPEVRLRFDYEIGAQKIMNHLILSNKHLEKQIEAGMKFAVDELSKDDRFLELVKEQTKKEIEGIFRRTITHFAADVGDAIAERLTIRSEEVAKIVVDGLFANINMEQNP